MKANRCELRYEFRLAEKEPSQPTPLDNYATRDPKRE